MHRDGFVHIPALMMLHSFYYIPLGEKGLLPVCMVESWQWESPGLIPSRRPISSFTRPLPGPWHCPTLGQESTCHRDRFHKSANMMSPV